MKTRWTVLLLISAIGLMSIAARTDDPQPASSIPIYLADGTPLKGVHIVVGTVHVPLGGASVEMKGPAAFSNAGSYRCFPSIQRGPIPGNIPRVDGSKFLMPAGTSGGWDEDYLCIGN